LNIPEANPRRMQQMRALLETAFAPVALEVIDDSHRHVGHAGARDGHGHFTVDIVSDRFAGMSSVARHRAIYAALGTMLTTDIHALSIRAATPDERA
jgi:BolA protein